MSKSYYQCLLFKQFTTTTLHTFCIVWCQRAIINVYFSSNSQHKSHLFATLCRCQRAIINVYFSSNSQLMRLWHAGKRRCQRAIINVYFSSNSQLDGVHEYNRYWCQRAIINVYFSSNSQPTETTTDNARRCQRAIINVYFSSNYPYSISLFLFCFICYLSFRFHGAKIRIILHIGEKKKVEPRMRPHSKCHCAVD